MTDIRDEIARTLSENWHNMHTNESLGMQLMLADAIMPIIRRGLAEAWVRGFDAGERDVMEHETFDEPCIANPYIEQKEAE